MPSSIVSIPGQPIVFAAADENCKCSLPSHCLLNALGDELYFQLQLQPCGTVNACNNGLLNDLICNGDFELGSELVTNGTFTGAATGWTLGTNWAYETNDVRASAAAAGQTLSQTIASLTVGKTYVVSFNISSYVSGNVAVTLGGTTGTTRSADGTYSQVIQVAAGTTLSFERVSVNFSGDIDDVSVRLVDCWSFEDPWTWSGGTACNDGTGIADILLQTINPTGGAIHQINFTISNYVQGNVTFELGGDLYPDLFNAAGTYSVYMAAGAGTDIEFFGNSFDGCIGDISIYEISPCWDADETTWNQNATGACHVAGNTTVLSALATPLTIGLYYHITFTVSSATAGGVTLKANTAAIGAQTSGNGTFDRWGTADGTGYGFTPSSDFDGCISDVEIIQYNIDYLFHLLDENDNLVFDLTGLTLLSEDIVTLDGETMAGFGVEDYGCYTICIVDGCYGDIEQFADNIIDNGDFSLGAANWTSSGATFSGNLVTLDAGTGAYIQQAIKTTGAINCMNLTFGYVNEGSGNVIIYINGLNSYSIIVTGGGSAQIPFDYEIPAGAVIRIEGMGLTQPLQIDNVVLSVPGTCRVYDQCSPCIKYDASFDCTKLIEAYSAGDSLQFEFDDSNGLNQFKLVLRVACDLLHASYEQEQDDYIFSTGSSDINFGQSTKYQSLFFNPIPTYKHDTIALQKICDTFLIDSVEYFAKKGDYNPEWNRNDATDLAPSRIAVKKKTETRFNTNCE